MTHNKLIHTIIFDVGGTLVDAPDLLDVLANQIKKVHSIDVRKELGEEFSKLYGSEEFKDIKSILNEITLKILNNYNINSSNINPAQIYADLFINKSFLFEESKEVLTYLKQKNLNLIIVSDADVDVLIPELKKLEIYDDFQEILASSDLKCYKTSKNIIRNIIPKITDPLNKILFVGDTIADINTAKELGVKSVLMCRKTTSLEADFKIKSLRELKNIIYD